VQWLTSLGRKSTTQDEAADKPVDVNQFKETFQPDDGRVTPTERRKSADARRRQQAARRHRKILFSDLVISESYQGLGNDLRRRG
jgi:hypothetical protein